MVNSDINTVIEFLYEHFGCMIFREHNFLRFAHYGRDCGLEFHPTSKKWYIIAWERDYTLEPISESEGLETGQLLLHIFSIPDDFLIWGEIDPKRRILFNETMLAKHMNEAQEMLRTLGFQIEYTHDQDFVAYGSKIKIRMTLNLWDWYITISDLCLPFEPLFHNDMVCDHWSLSVDYLKKIIH